MAAKKAEDRIDAVVGTALAGLLRVWVVGICYGALGQMTWVALEPCLIAILSWKREPNGPGPAVSFIVGKGGFCETRVSFWQ